MKTIHLVVLLLLFAAACTVGKSGTGDLPPIIIDLSARPSPTAGPVGLSAALAPTATPAPAVPTAVIPPTPESAEAQVVAAQIEAFNRHDLEAFLASYAADAVLYDQPDRVRQSGIAEIRQAYAAAFAANPNLHVTVSSRIVQGRLVIQQEVLTGAADGQTRISVATYEVVGGKITRVGFTK
jgi:hypothetical protein